MYWLKRIKNKTNLITKEGEKKMKNYLQKLLAIQVLAPWCLAKAPAHEGTTGLKVLEKRGSEMFGVQVLSASSTGQVTW